MNDFLKECMQDPALVKGPMPIDEFNKQVCMQCINSECARSRMVGMSTFVRAQNWKRDLFDNVPRAREDDPRYASIRALRFISPNMHQSISIETKTVKEPFIPEVLRKTNIEETDISMEKEEHVQDPENAQSAKSIDGLSLDSVKRLPGPGLIDISEDQTIHETPGLKKFLIDNMTVDDRKKTDVNNTKFQQGSMLGGGVISKPKEITMNPGSTFTFDDD